MSVKYPDIEVRLVGEDGNIFHLLGVVERSLRRARVGQSEIRNFRKEVTSSQSYDEALQVLMNWVVVV